MFHLAAHVKDFALIARLLQALTCAGGGDVANSCSSQCKAQGGELKLALETAPVETPRSAVWPEMQPLAGMECTKQIRGCSSKMIKDQRISRSSTIRLKAAPGNQPAEAAPEVWKVRPGRPPP